MKKRISIVTPLVIINIFAIVSLASCGSSVETANELAEALEKEGIEYDSIEKVGTFRSKYAKIEEAIALKGDNLNVEIYRIEDRRTYKAFCGSVLLLAVAEKKTGQRLPGRPSLYPKKPFVIVVRQEPEAGVVKRALENILPQKED